MSSSHPLRWTHSDNYPAARDLPANITRHFVPTHDGRLEVLVAEPHLAGGPRQRPVLFQHGGFGSAAVWIPWMVYLSQRSYPCYAISLRGHGASWDPGFLRMMITGSSTLARDLAAGVRWVEGEEAKKGNYKDNSVVLAGHSSGAGLVQYFLSKGITEVRGVILCAPIPGSGS